MMCSDQCKSWKSVTTVASLCSNWFRSTETTGFEDLVRWIFFCKVIKLNDSVLLRFSVLPGMVFLQKSLHLHLPLLVWEIGFTLQLGRLLRSIPSVQQENRLNICFLYANHECSSHGWFNTLNHSLVFCSNGNAEHNQGCNANNESNYDDPTRSSVNFRVRWFVS